MQTKIEKALKKLGRSMVDDIKLQLLKRAKPKIVVIIVNIIVVIIQPII